MKFRCFATVVIGLIVHSTTIASEIFRTTDILDPRVLGGSFACNRVSTTAGQRANPLVDTLGGDEFELCNDFEETPNIIQTSSYTLGFADNLVFNSIPSQAPVRFATYTFNRHVSDKQHTFSLNLFDSQDDEIIPSYRMEYALGNYSLYRSGDEERLQRVQFYGRLEDYKNRDTSFDLGVRFFAPSFLMSPLNVEFDLRHKFDNSGFDETDLLLTTYYNNLTPLNLESRFDVDFKWVENRQMTVTGRAEIAKQFRLRRNSVRFFLSYVIRDGHGQIETGLTFGRLLARELAR